MSNNHPDPKQRLDMDATAAYANELTIIGYLETLRASDAVCTSAGITNTIVGTNFTNGRIVWSNTHFNVEVDYSQYFDNAKIEYVVRLKRENLQSWVTSIVPRRLHHIIEYLVQKTSGQFTTSTSQSWFAQDIIDIRDKRTMDILGLMDKIDNNQDEE